MSLFLLSNPTSGGSNSSSSWLESARRRLGEQVGRWTEVVVRPGEDITAMTTALMNTEIPLAILPTGTVNVLARELGIYALDPATTVDIGLGAHTRVIDVGVCNDTIFLLMCSGGIDSATVGQVNAGLKNAVGATAYAFAAIGALTTFTPPTVRITIDGVALPETDIFLVAVGNTSLYGGDLKLLPAASLEDGLLDIAIFTAPVLPASIRNAAFLPQLADAALGRHAQSDNIWIYQGKDIRLESDQPLLLQSDGDLSITTPAIFTISSRALHIKTLTAA